MFTLFFGGGIAIFAFIILALIFSKFFFGLLLWFLIKLPLTLIFFALGTVLCCTIFLIPLGIMCFRIGGGMLIPGV